MKWCQAFAGSPLDRACAKTSDSASDAKSQAKRSSIWKRVSLCHDQSLFTSIYYSLFDSIPESQSLSAHFATKNLSHSGTVSASAKVVSVLPAISDFSHWQISMIRTSQTHSLQAAYLLQGIGQNRICFYLAVSSLKGLGEGIWESRYLPKDFQSLS